MTILDELETAALKTAREDLGLNEADRRTRLMMVKRSVVAGVASSLQDVEIPPLRETSGTELSPAPALRDSSLKTTDPEALTQAVGAGVSRSLGIADKLGGVSPFAVLGLGVTLGGVVGFVAGTLLSFGALVAAREKGPSLTVSTPKAVVEDSEIAEFVIGSEVETPPPFPAEKPALQVLEGGKTLRRLKSLENAKATATQKSESPPPTVYEEMSYLRRAQAALRSGKPELALGLMRDLDTLAPRGSLGVERRLTKVFALCALARIDEARAIGRSFRASKPGAVYLRRLNSSCAKPQSEPLTQSAVKGEKKEIP